MDPKLLSLAPTDALDPQKDQDFKAYYDHLTGVYNDDSLRNIAMIGNRGSGKSSILRSFDARRHQGQRKFLYISLTDFEGSAGKTEEDPEQTRKTEEDPEQTRKRLEYSLLCQILARCTADDLKNSTLKGIPEIRRDKLRPVRYTWFLLTGLLILGLLFEDRFGALLTGWGMPGIWRVGLHALGYVLAFLSLGVGFLYLRRRRPELVHIGKLTVKTPHADAELTPSGDKYCLDQFKFELIYILNQIADKIGCTVVFEDMERIRDKAVCARIMTRLRELNALTNTHRQTQGAQEHIRFIYALSDDLFDCESRTKFFDIIVPVIPVLNPTNAGEMIINLLRDSDTHIDRELIKLLAPHLSDYRVVRSMVNEYFLLERLHAAHTGQGHVFFDSRNHLLALTAYKTLFPKEYAYAFSKEGFGILPRLKEPEYTAAQVQLVEELYEKKYLGMHTLNMVGYPEQQLRQRWINILENQSANVKLGLLRELNQTSGTGIQGRIRKRGLFEKEKDPLVAAAIGRYVYDASSELTGRIKYADRPNWLFITDGEPKEIPVDQQLFVSILAYFSTADPGEHAKLTDVQKRKLAEFFYDGLCHFSMEPPDQTGWYNSWNELWRPFGGDFADTLLEYLGNERKKLPKNVLDKMLGGMTLEDHILDFEEDQPDLSLLTDSSPAPSEEPAPT